MSFEKSCCLIKNLIFAAKVQKNLHMSKLYTNFAAENENFYKMIVKFS